MAINDFSAQHDALIYFQEFPGIFFTSKEGGDSQNDVTQTFPGGGGPPVNVSGPTTITPVTVSKPMDPIVDAPLKAWARAWDLGVRQELTLVVQPTTSEGLPVGEPDIHIGCAKTTVTRANATKGSAETRTFSISVQPRSMA